MYICVREESLSVCVCVCVCVIEIDKSSDTCSIFSTEVFVLHKPHTINYPQTYDPVHHYTYQSQLCKYVRMSYIIIHIICR